MKFLKYFIIFLLVLAAIVLAKGLLSPTVSYESEVTVNKSASESWAVMNDDTKMSTWLPGYVKSEQVSGTPNTVGAVSKVYFNEAGQETVMTETVTSIVPNEKLGMSFLIDGFMDMDYEMTMKESGGETIISSNTKAEGIGLLNKSIVSFMKGAMKSQEDTNMEALRDLINANTTQYEPVGVTHEAPILLE